MTSIKGPIAVDRINPTGEIAVPSKVNPTVSGADFKALLDKKVLPGGPATAVGSAEKIKFSGHAIERMRSRGISLNPEMLGKLEGAVDRAEQKGAKETLVLTPDAALIVNIKNKTVVTAMDKNSLKENIFTNIDSTVVL